MFTFSVTSFQIIYILEILNIIFRLGVVFAIFGFIWGFFQLIYMLLRGRNTQNIGEAYLVKAIKYFFLVDVTFLFTMDSNEINVNQLIITCLVLVAYFVGKLQNQQKKMMMFQMVSNGMRQDLNKFNLKAEIGVIVFAVLFFVGFIFFPEYAKNPLSIWFHQNILDIEKAAILGFIFKVIGFFFLVNIIMKMINAFTLLLSGTPIVQSSASTTFQNEKPKKEDDFDDYEEL
jgi:hypothetical protein